MESHIPPAEVRFSSCQTAFSLRVYHVCEGPTPRGVCAQYVKTSPYYTLLYSHKATACRTHRDTQREQWAMDYGKTKQPMRHTPMRRTDTRQTTASTRTRSFLHLNATTHNPPIHPSRPDRARLLTSRTRTQAACNPPNTSSSCIEHYHVLVR